MILLRTPKTLTWCAVLLLTGVALWGWTVDPARPGRWLFIALFVPALWGMSNSRRVASVAASGRPSWTGTASCSPGPAWSWRRGLGSSSPWRPIGWTPCGDRSPSEPGESSPESPWRSGGTFCQSCSRRGSQETSRSTGRGCTVSSGGCSRWPALRWLACGWWCRSPTRRDCSHE